MLQSDVQVSAVRLCGKVPWLAGKNRQFPVSCSSYTHKFYRLMAGGYHKNAAASPTKSIDVFCHRQPATARLRPSVILAIQPIQTRKSSIHLRRATCAIQDRHVNVTICDLFCQILRPQLLQRVNIASILCQFACKNVAYRGL
jgi:hypothetical protein